MPVIRPQAGLPFETLPGTEVNNPRGTVQLQFQQEANRVQDEYNRKRQLIIKNAPALGHERAQSMLTQLEMRTGESATALKNELQTKTQYFDQIDAMEKAGLISNGDEIRWRLAVGRDVADSMFPKQQKPEMLDLSQARSQIGSQISRTQKELGAFEPGAKKWFGRFRTSELMVEDPVSGEMIPASRSETERHRLLTVDLKKAKNLERALLKGGKFARGAAKLILEDKVDSSTLQQKIMASKVMQQPKKARKIRVKVIGTDQTGSIPENEYDDTIYERI